jgi:hypothetical protein
MRVTRFEWGKQILVLVMTVAMVSAGRPTDAQAYQDPPQSAPPQPVYLPQDPTPQDSGTPRQPSNGQPAYAPQSPEQLQQLVAPIALYPDSLVAQVLAASAFPEQVVEADRWVQAHADLKGEALGQAVDQQPWDPSVKALTAFPSVLGNMDKNLSWTSSLGDAYYNQQQDVMDAVQLMRQKAEQAGNLKSTPQQNVTTQGSTVVIEPADPQIVYVPAYDPWIVYGGPIVAWPGWYPYPGIWYGGGPFLSFGVGFGIGFYGGYGWGWGRWGFDWHNRYPIYNRGRYYSQSRTFYNRNTFYRGGAQGGGRYNAGNRPPNAGGERSGVYNRPGAAPRPFEGDKQAARGFGQSHGGDRGVRSGAFSGYDHGGETRSYASRGQSSFGGGRGGGGARGGGGRGGGGRH